MSNAIESQGASLAIETASSTFTHIAEIKDWSAFGGAASVIDVTSLDSEAKEKRMGLQDYGQVTINFNHVPTDAGQTALEAAKASRAEKNFKLTLNDALNTTYAFAGFVLSKSMDGGVEQAVSGSVTIEITGTVTVTSDGE